MSFVAELKALEAFAALPRAQRTLCVYSEGPEYWPHLGGIVRHLLETWHCPLTYVSSSSNDPGLEYRHPLLRTFCIGSRGSRVNWFKDMDADILLLTMPDLGNLTLAKSHSCGSYVYAFHSPVSTHMVYREGAFDNYDVVLCAGPHHERELRRRERMLGLPAKTLIPHGYGRLDHLIEGAPMEAGNLDGGTFCGQVLLAPSWGPSGLFETAGVQIVGSLLDAGYRVVARPHPQTSRLAPEVIAALRAAFDHRDGFEFDADMSGRSSFYASDVVVSDWSGAALDFAFARLRPAVFIDTPRKVNNPRYGELGEEPLEVAIRSRIGKIVPPNDAAALVDAVAAAMSETGVADRIQAERQRAIYNVGSSDAIAAAELARRAFEVSLGGSFEGGDISVPCRKLADCLFRQSLKRSGETASLPAFMLELADAEATQIEPRLPELEALCKRIDVHRVLHLDYTDGFARPVDGNAKADRDAFPLLILLFLDAAAAVAAKRRGLALKFVNSAGNLLDLYYADGGVSGAVTLEHLVTGAHQKHTASAA